ncbi:MAG: hypothetical protein COB07_04170 [Sulfurovum sp.]|nr:MAG: hypothetical protein COB07_04170 [Sulfurovum sp.]
MLLGASSLTAADNSALDIINKALQYTSSLNTYAFTANIVEDEEQEDGTSIAYTYITSVKVKRPGQLRIDTKSKFLNRSITIDNGLFTIMRHSDNTYSQLSVSKNTDKAIESILTKYDIKEPLASLVYSDMAKRVTSHHDQYLGTKNVDGVLCDYLLFKSKHSEIHVWVTKGDRPQIKAYKIKDTGEHPYVTTKTKITWDVNRSIQDSDFVFHAPKNSKKVVILTEKSDG